MSKTKCPKCGSEDAEKIDIIGSKAIVCNNCGYDESEELENPESKGRKKGRNVYRTGGGRRSVSKK